MSSGSSIGIGTVNHFLVEGCHVRQHIDTETACAKAAMRQHCIADCCRVPMHVTCAACHDRHTASRQHSADGGLD